MTSWTLDISKLQYYSTIGSLTVWGDPEAGDEIVLPNGFSYILSAPVLQSPIRDYFSGEEFLEMSTRTSEIALEEMQGRPLTPGESFQPITSEVEEYMREIRELGLLR